MKRFFLHTLFLISVLSLVVGCKKPAPADADSTAPASEEPEGVADDVTDDDGPLKAAFDAELLHTFEGTLNKGSKKRPEDHTPVAHHEFDLTEGDHIYVEMNALDTFRTYLLIATPNETGGYQNSECYPGQGLSSCVRFVANQTGTYLFMANAAQPRAEGNYTLSIYKETEEQAKKNAEEHAKVAAQSKQRLQKHIEQKRKDNAERRAKRKAAQERLRKAARDADQNAEQDADAEKDTDPAGN